MTILSNFGSADTAIISPATFTFAFPKSINGAPQDNEFYVKTVLLSAVRGRVPAEYSGFSGKIFRPETAADYASPSSTDPTNKTELDDFSTKFATDWLVWQFNRIDAVLSGVVDWEPDGFGDLIFDLSSWNITTRVFGDQPYPKDSVVRTAGTFGSITTIYNVFNNSTNIYNSYYYNNVTNVFNTNFYITNLTVNNFTTNIFNFYGCNDLVNTGVRFNFIDNIKCDDDGYYYYRLNEFKQTYDYTGCPVTTITKLGLIPFGCCDLSCVPDPPPPPWEYCCESYPDEVCGVLTKIDVGIDDTCNCGNSKWILKIEHSGTTATYWGGDHSDGSTWEVLRVDGNDYLGFCGPDSCCWATEEGNPNIVIGGPADGSGFAVFIDGLSEGVFSFTECQDTYTWTAFAPDGSTIATYILAPSASAPPDPGDTEPEVTTLCLTLIDGCYVGTVILEEILFSVTICCVGTADDPLRYEVVFEYLSDTYTFQSISVQCGLTDYYLDFGIINIRGINYRFSVFVDSTGTCCVDEPSDSLPPLTCTNSDHGYGETGWFWSESGWVEDGSIVCTGGGIPNYPSGDGFSLDPPTHTTTWCCPPGDSCENAIPLGSTTSVILDLADGATWFEVDLSGKSNVQIVGNEALCDGVDIFVLRLYDSCGGTLLVEAAASQPPQPITGGPVTGTYKMRLYNNSAAVSLDCTNVTVTFS